MELTQNRLYTFADTIGFATDLAPLSRGVQYLDKCENAYFEKSGSIRKFGGELKVNSTAFSGAPNVTGFYDFWRSGTSGSSAQMVVAMTADSKIYAEQAMDGVQTDITGAATITADAIPYFFVARDTLIILNDKADTPLSWAQSGNVASLGGSPPAGRVGIYHVNRPWITNTNANPSRLLYGSSTSVTDYTGADTGTIDISPEDGDRILGLAVNRGRLLIFKGPNKGSIHVMSGRTVSTFVVDFLIAGNPLQSMHGLLDVGNDVWMLSDTGIYSINAVQEYGDWKKADITPFLKNFFRDSINRSRMASAQAINYEDRSTALFCLTPLSDVENNLTLGISYTNPQKLKYFTVPGRSCISAGIRIHPTTKLREACFGTTDGFIKRQDVSARSLDGAGGYTYRVRTPAILIGEVNKAGQEKIDQPVNLRDLLVRSESVGNYNLAVSIQRDDKAEQTFTIGQGGAGFVLDTSQLDIDTLGGGGIQTARINEPVIGGNCRSVIIDLQQSGANQDANVFEVGLKFSPVSESRATDLEDQTQ